MNRRVASQARVWRHRLRWERCQSGAELTFPGIEWVEVNPGDDVVLELTPTLHMGIIQGIAKAPGDDLPRASGEVVAMVLHREMQRNDRERRAQAGN